MIWQIVQSAMFPETPWTIEIAQVPPNAIVTTSRASALRFLEILRKNVTGARPLSIPLPSDHLTSTKLLEKDIIDGLALEVCLDHREEPWVVAPKRFFKEPPSPRPSLTSSPGPLVLVIDWLVVIHLYVWQFPSLVLGRVNGCWWSLALSGGSIEEGNDFVA